MPKIAIVTDTIACLTREQLEQYGIAVVPVRINVNGHEYREFLDISASEAYQLLDTDPERFFTSPVPPAELTGVFRSLASEAEAILCINVSAKLSAQYSFAQVAAEQTKKELPGTAIELVDSKLAAAAEGFVVLAAARAASEGKTLQETIEAAEGVRDRMRFVLVLDTIRHAYRTGRIPKVASRVGSAINVKPILTISGGVVRFAGVARSKQQGVNHMLRVMRNEAGGKSVHVAVVHADCPDEATMLKHTIESEFSCTEIWLSEFSPVMGYATGRGLLGVAFYTDV